MTSFDMEYCFTSKTHYYSSNDNGGWVFVSLPKEIAIEIRDNFKRREEGWGRLKVTAKVRNSEWQTSLWFDTKKDTYLLPLKTSIRKKENIALNEKVSVSIFI